MSTATRAIAAGTAALGAATRPTGTELPAVPDPAVRRRNEAARTVKYLMVFRVALATLLLLAVVLVALGQGEVDTLSSPFGRFVFGLLATTYLVSVIYGLAFKHVRDPVRFAYTQMAVDLALASVLIHATGGGESGFFFLYFVDVVAVALLAERRGAAIVAGASIVMMMAVPLAGYYRLLPLVPGQSSLPWEIAQSALTKKLALNVAALVAVGFLASALAAQTRAAGERVIRHERHAGDLARLHENIVRCLTSGLVTVDLDGRLTSMNDAACEILGTSSERLAGRPIAERVPELAAMLGELDVRRTLRRVEVSAVRPDGAVRNLGLSVGPLSDHAGRVIGRVIHFQDLTELRRMELRVHRAERLAGIGRLAAGIAHEIRNPLASISGSIEMLKTAPAAEADESAQLMDIVLREVDRLNALITGLLDYARPPTEERRLLDLGEHAAEVLRAFEHDRGTQHLKVVLEAQAGVLVDAAPGQLRQVLWNLVRNAAEAMPEGGTLRVSVHADAGQRILAVSDSGPGIPRQDLERIFEPFYSTKSGGTGLGLPTVARVVEDHRGTIDIDTEPGVGTTFTVRLPAPRTENTPTPTPRT